MTPSHRSNGRRLLVVEPRVEGHHPGWLRFITEDLLSAGYQLVLAVDLRPRSRAIIEEHLGDLVSQVGLIPVLDDRGRPRSGGIAASIRVGLEESGAPRAFLCAFDELASAAFRRAAMGLNPPPCLRGRIGGIYHRPRFTVAPWWSPNRLLKARGFRKFVNRDWINPLLLLDEYLARDVGKAFPGKPIFFLPDPCPDDFGGDGLKARDSLGVPAQATVFLFFGVGARRKGLHLAVEAMSRLVAENAFLLVAGRQNPPPAVRRGLDRLKAQKRALLLDRYVSSEEEKWCFQAADVVLLPYLNHFGTSGILSRAMATGKPVIASDEQLLGKLVGDNDLGWRFPSGDVAALSDCLAEAAAMNADLKQKFVTQASRYADRHSRDGFRKALLAALQEP